MARHKAQASHYGPSTFAMDCYNKLSLSPTAYGNFPSAMAENKILTLKIQIPILFTYYQREVTGCYLRPVLFRS